MFEAFKDAGGYTTESYWSPEGWDWVGHRVVAGLPKPCEGDAPTSRAAASPGTRPRRTPRGAAAVSRPRPSGSTRLAVRRPRSTRGATTWDPAKANVVDSAGAGTGRQPPVGESWVGAQDMAGNAMEWVSDWLGPYSDAPATDPTGPAEGTIKVEKGGWWGSNPFVARSAYRHYEDPPTYSDEHIGFRVVSAS